MSPVYEHVVQVTAAMVDGNGHANNVAYIQWMQEAAVEHARVSGCTRASVAVGATWVVRSHCIEYLRPTFAGDTVRVLTWVADWRKVRSLRKYKLVRASDQKVVAEAETDWVLVDVATGRPRTITEEIRRALPVVSEAPRAGE
jgi:acyl-CoA thioester hydrolase